jgi:hypothetical protein
MLKVTPTSIHVVNCTGVQKANCEDQAEADRMPGMFARVSDCFPVLAIGLAFDGILILIGWMVYRHFVKQ